MGGKRLARIAAAISLLALLAAFADVALIASNVPKVPKEEPLPVIYDKPLDKPAEVPVYLQADERWGGLSYAGDDLATSGCGLTCAAMAWEWLYGQTCTPAQMLDLVGESCLTDGVNDMDKFCRWMNAHDQALGYTPIHDNADAALNEAASGWMVFCSLTGRLREGGKSYGGHIVLLCGWDGTTATFHDPYEGIVRLSREQYEQVNWAYFIAIGSAE